MLQGQEQLRLLLVGIYVLAVLFLAARWALRQLVPSTGRAEAGVAASSQAAAPAVGASPHRQQRQTALMASLRQQPDTPTDLVRAAQFSDTTIGTSTLAGESSIPSSSALSIVQALSPHAPAAAAAAHPHARALAKQASVNRSRTAIQALHEANEALRHQAEALASAAEEEVHMPSEQATTAAVQRFLSRRMSRNASRASNSRGANVTSSGTRQNSTEAAAAAAVAAVPPPGAEVPAASAPPEGTNAAEAALTVMAAADGAAAMEAVAATSAPAARTWQAAAATTSSPVTGAPAGASAPDQATGATGTLEGNTTLEHRQEAGRAVAAEDAATTSGGITKPAEVVVAAVAEVSAAVRPSTASAPAANGTHGAAASSPQGATAHKAVAMPASAPMHAEAGDTAVGPNAESHTVKATAEPSAAASGPAHQAEQAASSAARSAPVVQATLAASAAEAAGPPSALLASKHGAASSENPGAAKKKAKRPGLFACFGR